MRHNHLASLLSLLLVLFFLGGFFAGAPGASPANAEDTGAPALTIDQPALATVGFYTQTLLLNATRERDIYATYSGLPLGDLLAATGVLPDATSVTIIAADGYTKTFPIDAVLKTHPPSVYYGNLAWVDYQPGPQPKEKQVLSDPLFMLLAWEREGETLGLGAPAQPDSGETLVGEGPFRIIIPQAIASPPDRSMISPDKDAIPYPYDPKADHNAGLSVRSVVAIRINPLPEGFIEPDWAQIGWDFLPEAKVVVYGAIDPAAAQIGVIGMPSILR